MADKRSTSLFAIWIPLPEHLNFCLPEPAIAHHLETVAIHVCMSAAARASRHDDFISARGFAHPSPLIPVTAYRVPSELHDPCSLFDGVNRNQKGGYLCIRTIDVDLFTLRGDEAISPRILRLGSVRLNALLC